MYQAMVRETKGAFNQIVYWSRLPDWKNQTLTPNPDAIYLMPFFNTKDVGPVVLEIPPADDGSITGNVVDVWQAALEDVGPPGVHKGGCKHVILPPATKTKPRTATPRCHPRPIRATHCCDPSSGAAPTPTWPRPPPMASASSYTRFHRPPIRRQQYSWMLSTSCSTHRVVQSEPWLERYKAMIDQLKSIGIEKRKPFTTDTKTQAILKAAAREAKAGSAKCRPYFAAVLLRRQIGLVRGRRR
jgi:hypothetical protein